MHRLDQLPGPLGGFPQFRGQLLRQQIEFRTFHVITPESKRRTPLYISRPVSSSVEFFYNDTVLLGPVNREKGGFDDVGQTPGD